MDLFHSFYSFKEDCTKFDMVIEFSIDIDTFISFCYYFYLIIDPYLLSLSKIENRFCFTKEVKILFVFCVTLDLDRVSGQPDFPFPILIILQNGGNVDKV